MRPYGVVQVLIAMEDGEPKLFRNDPAGRWLYRGGFIANISHVVQFVSVVCAVTEGGEHVPLDRKSKKLSTIWRRS